MKKGKRLKDVLDEEYKDYGWIIKKLLQLKAHIIKANVRLDEEGGEHLRWIDRVLGEYEDEGVVPVRSELHIANTLWRKYR